VVRPGPIVERYLSGSNVLWRFLAIIKDRIVRARRLASFAHKVCARDWTFPRLCKHASYQFLQPTLVVCGEALIELMLVRHLPNLLPLDRISTPSGLPDLNFNDSYLHSCLRATSFLPLAPSPRCIYLRNQDEMQLSSTEFRHKLPTLCDQK
jgi:hypothetical protein